MRGNLTIMDGNLRLSAVLERPALERCPLVIVLHGLTSSKERKHTIAACAAMREAGVATLRFDLYGHGESDGNFRDHTLSKWISNTLAVMDYASRLDFVTEIWLSGHSQGGLTAALAAGAAPERVSGLILRAPAFMIPRCARAGDMLGIRFDPDRPPAEAPTIKGLTLRSSYIRDAQSIHVEKAIDAFPGPVLILYGDRDDLVPMRDIRMAAERYRACTLKILCGETHHFDRRTDEMQQMIRTWLAEAGSAPENGTISCTGAGQDLGAI